MLTSSQLTALKSAILADPVLAAKPNTPDGAFDIAVAFNLPATPTFMTWRSSVSIDAIMGNGFDWTRVDNLTVGKSRIWEWMTKLGTVNPSKPNVRAGFEACFSVEAGDQPNRQAIYDASSRPCSRAEKLFATGTGSAPTHHGVGPATMGFEGLLTYQDVLDARAS